MTSLDLPDDPVGELLAFYPLPIALLAQRLSALVKRAVPQAIERVRPGWRLIGYDLPLTRRGVYFAWVWPEPHHVHVGWQTGTLMSDPDRVLRGAHLRLKKVRYLTFAATDHVTPRIVVDFTRDAARIAAMSHGERELLAAARRAPASGR